MANPTDSLRTYMPRVLWVECLRCKRRGEMKADKMRSRYGDITLGELAQRVAEQGGCALAAGDESECDAQVVEPPIEIWGRLRDAEKRGLRAVLVCRRRYYALKQVQSCPPVDLDLPTLIGALGSDYPLDRLSAKVRCPHCETKGAEVQWHGPDDPPDPGGVAAPEPQPTFRRRPDGPTRLKVVNGRG